MRPGTASLHLFGEGLHLPEVFFQLDLGNKRPFATLAVSDAQATKRLEGLPCRHAADAQAFGNDFLRRKGFAGLEPARANVLKKMLLNLKIERNDAVAVEIEGLHFTPQLSRQLG